MKTVATAALLGVLCMSGALSAASIRGMAVDAKTGEPVTGATAYLIQGRLGNFSPLDSAATGDDGGYEFTGLDTGFYVVGIIKEGYSPLNMYVRIHKQDQEVGQRAELSPGGFRPEGDGIIEGIVTGAETGGPLDGAAAILLTQNLALDTAFTAEGGTFRFGPLSRFGDYSISVSMEGYVPQRLSHLWFGPEETLRVEIGLEKEPEPSAVITGEVTDSATDEPVANALVVLLSDTNAAIPGTAWKALDTALTDENGGFRFEKLHAAEPRNPYSVLVTADRYMHQASSPVTIMEGGTEHIEIRLRPLRTGNLCVKVTAKNVEEKTLDGANVSVVSFNGLESYEETTGTDGWACFDSVAVGTYTIAASYRGYIVESTNRRIDEGTADTVFLSLVEGRPEEEGIIAGIVRENDGMPLEGAVVTFLSERDNSRLAVSDTSDDSGRYVIPGLYFPFNRGVVSAAKDGYEDFAIEVFLTTDTLALDIELKPASGALRPLMRDHTPGGGPVVASIIHNGNRRAVSIRLEEGPAHIRIQDCLGKTLCRCTLPKGSHILYPGPGAPKILCVAVKFSGSNSETIMVRFCF
jgi:hypothetical protein